MTTNDFVATIRRAATLLGLAFHAAAFAAPANDQFLNAIVLTGAPVSATGNNIGATLESGEFDPNGYGGASVWYRWAAPTTGWFEITTRSDDPAHDLDTIIVIHTGAATPAAAPVLGFNDDDAESLKSRLVFRATAGTDYRVAVHGYDSEAGAFRLTIAPVAPPAAVVSSLTFSPAAVDVGATPADATASVTVESTSPLTGLGVRLFDPTGDHSFGSIELGPDDRISGTPLAGVYQALIHHRRLSRSGQLPGRRHGMARRKRVPMVGRGARSPVG